MDQPPPDDTTSHDQASDRTSSALTTVDWLLCFFCFGIALIVGIVRLIQGKPSGGKMIMWSLVIALAWGVIGAIFEAN